MEYDITEFFNTGFPRNFSASAFELGDNAEFYKAVWPE